MGKSTRAKVLLQKLEHTRSIKNKKVHPQKLILKIKTEKEWEWLNNLLERLARLFLISSRFGIEISDI